MTWKCRTPSIYPQALSTPRPQLASLAEYQHRSTALSRRTSVLRRLAFIMIRILRTTRLGSIDSDAADGFQVLSVKERLAQVCLWRVWVRCRWSTRELLKSSRRIHPPRRAIRGQSIVFGAGPVTLNWVAQAQRERLAWDIEVIARNAGIKFLVISIISLHMIDGCENLREAFTDLYTLLDEISGL